MPKREVTIVIPTTAEQRRGRTIERAIGSVVGQSGVAAQALVVVNGPAFSPELVEALRVQPGTRVLQIAEASMPAALLAGRRALDTPWFGFLDDDDELLDGALARRIDVLVADPQAGFLISNGELDIDGLRSPVVVDAAPIHRDPLMTLMDYNWLCTSASGLYRAERVGPDELAAMPKYLEWTYMGVRLLSSMRCRFLDEITYRKYDLPGSVSRSDAYRLGIVEAMQSILALPLPAAVRRRMRAKLGAAHHDLAVILIGRGEVARAWRHHMRSLVCPGGLRYLAFGRQLVQPAIWARSRPS